MLEEDDQTDRESHNPVQSDLAQYWDVALPYAEKRLFVMGLMREAMASVPAQKALALLITVQDLDITVPPDLNQTFLEPMVQKIDEHVPFLASMQDEIALEDLNLLPVAM